MKTPTALQKIKEIENNYECAQEIKWTKNPEHAAESVFLLKAFNVMREIAISNQESEFETRHHSKDDCVKDID